MSDNNSKYDQPIAGHDYDGIQEFDNPLPMWWLWTFLGTIIFAFIYYVHYELGGGPSSNQELKADMAAIEVLKKNEPTISPEEILAAVNSKEKVEAGLAIFKQKCASCHGQSGEGLIGPNMTDKFWINGQGTPQDILAVVRKGVLEKGMPPWKDVLKTPETLAVVAFIVSLQGTTPANPKAPQGTEYPSNK